MGAQWSKHCHAQGAAEVFEGLIDGSDFAIRGVDGPIDRISG